MKKEMFEGSEVVFQCVMTKSSFIDSVMKHMSYEEFYEYRILDIEDEYEEEDISGAFEIIWDMEDDLIYDLFFGDWDGYTIWGWYWDNETGPEGIWGEINIDKKILGFMKTGEYKTILRDKKISELGL